MDDNARKKCDYCTFSFVGHAKYYNHARKDHSDIVATTWEACSKCSKRFPDKKALVRKYFCVSESI
jgi:biotin synthase-like enzyme